MAEDGTARFWIASADDIRSGAVADVYFENTLTVLAGAGLDPVVTAEVRARTLPGRVPRALFCGLAEVVALLDGIEGLDVDALGEGEAFGPDEPVLVLRGPYRRFALHETALLGLICQASGVATATARLCTAAGGKPVLSFGARRQHPAIAPMIDRAAWIGGADGISSMLAAKELGIRATGTMPHALMLVVGDTAEAARLFDRYVDSSIARIVLIDTFGDEAVESVRVAEALGPRLAGVRLDTPASRRGDFRALIGDVRWELDTRGFTGVKLFVSGGLGLDDVEALADVADGFGIGSAISRASHVDFGLDLVTVDGQPRAKRGKRSGEKVLLRDPVTGERRVLRATDSWAGAEPVLRPLLRNGRLVEPLPPTAVIRERARKSWSA